jgi:hypothetical protein
MPGARVTGLAVSSVYACHTHTALWTGSVGAGGTQQGSQCQHLDIDPYTCLLSLHARRFLDAQRIASLTRYLEQLHACGLAGADHTTLLLNCYTKLKDVAKLDAFIHRWAESAAFSRPH